MKLRRKMYALHQNNAKKFLDKENTIALQANKISEQVTTLKSLSDELSSLKPQVDQLQRDKANLQRRVIYWRQMVGDLKEAHEHQAVEDFTKQQQQCSMLTEKLNELRQENTELKETVDSLFEHHLNLHLKTFKDGRYTDSIRACCYELLSLNVGIK